MSRRDAVANGAFVAEDGEEFDLVCGADYASERVELLEVDEEILSEILSNDGVIAFKGEPDDVAVVCTRSKTYQVTRVESSNQCLIVGPALGGEEDETEAMEEEEDGPRRATVRAQTSSHLDLTEIAPRLDRLREMMASVAYAGTAEAMDADEGEGEGVGFGFDELNARVQASELEILKCLQEEIVAIEIDGKWRGVDAEYRLHALAMMTASAFGNGWSTSALPTDAVVDAMASDGFAPEMARNTLHAFATKHDVDDTWALDEEAVCRALAQRVLRDGAGLKAWRLVEMMDQWREKLSEFNLGHVEAKEEYLSGLALIDRPERAAEAFVRALIASDLPREPGDRFAALWAVKPRWTLSELDPYLKGQARPGQNIEAQLLKYCRVTQGNPPTYSKR